MSMTFKVQEVLNRKTKAGKDYLLLKINDNLVSFFEDSDVTVPVEAGQTIMCDDCRARRIIRHLKNIK